MGSLSHTVHQRRTWFDMHLLGTKYLGLWICAALLILVVSEASGVPASEATVAPPPETTTPLNAALHGDSTRCHRLCFWNARRHARTNIGCWYRRGFGTGPCAE